MLYIISLIRSCHPFSNFTDLEQRLDEVIGLVALGKVF